LRFGHFTGLNRNLEASQVLLCHLSERFIKDRNIVLLAEADFGVGVECLIFRFTEIGCFEGDGFVAVFLGNLDAAIPVVVLDV